MKRTFLYHLLGLAITAMFLLSTSVSKAQDWTLDIMGSVKKEETKKRFEGVTITVKRNGAVWKTITSPANGKYDLKLPPDGIYLIEFSKFGHVSKKIEFSTKNVPPEDAKYGFEFPMEMNLFEKMEGLDVSVLNNPIAKVAFDPSTGYMDYDPAYTKSIQKELDRLKKELAERLKAEEENRKKNQKFYDEAIALGDKAFSAEKWEAAKVQYEKAEKLFPEEDYPGFQLAEISDKLAAYAEANKRYLTAIEKADAAFNAREWNKAINSYEYAAELKENEAYPINKVKEIEGILKNEKKVEEEYYDAIASGDAAMLTKDYADAKVNYQKALDLKDYETYPKDKLKEIDDILAEIAAKDKDYNDAIAEADGFFNEKNYEKSIESYKKAQPLKPEESYPQEKINEANELIAEQQKIEQDYQLLIADGDNAFTNKDYETAKAKYEGAIELKEAEQYPKDKITEIQELLDAAAKLEEDYETAIKTADDGFNSKDYATAQSNYEKALSLKSEEQYPKDKIAEIAQINAEEEAALMAQKELDEKYNALIASADAALNAEDYEKAKTDFSGALGLKSEEQYPKDKLAEIEASLAEIAKKKAEEEANALAQKELDEKYNTLIAAGDAAFSGADYEKALSDFNAAIGVKPDEQYPKDKIEEITNKMDELAKAEADAAAQKELNDKYNALIATADAALGNMEYEKAKSDYIAASEVKSEEQYPKDKLAEIEAKLKEFAEEEIRITAQKELDEKYNALLSSADNAFNGTDYEKAKSDYSSASELKPTESYPIGRLKEIENILAELAKKKAAEEASQMAQKELDEKYSALLASADDAFNAKDYEKAKTDFSSASGLKPSEQYPKDKLLEIENLLSDLANKKAGEEAAKLAQQELDKKYNNFISTADAALGSKNYDLAKKNYNFAVDIKPTEMYPKDKLREIENLLADLENKKAEDELAAEAERKKRDYFNAVVAQADGELVAKNYEEAKSKYSQALGIIPDEQYPKDKLAEIEIILAKLKAENENANSAQKEIDAKYNALISSADGLLEAKSYDAALSDYSTALKLKSAEAYPKNQIAKIKDILAELKRKEEEISVTNNAQKQKQEQYNNLIKNADEAFAAKQYKGAKSAYEQALGLMPSEAYPKKKIKEIQDILAEIARKEKESNTAELAEKQKRESYDKLIYDGDRSFRVMDYTMAQAKFNGALQLYPDEKYPSDKLAEILELLKKDKENEVVTVIPTNGSRASISDDKEKEIEARMAALKNKNNIEKEKELQKDKELYASQNEIRVKGNIERSNSADAEIDEYNKGFKETSEEQRKRSEAKSNNHYMYVDNVTEAQQAMIERGDGFRTRNRKAVEKLAALHEKKLAESNERAIGLQLDVNEYRRGHANEEKILVSSSIARTAGYKKDIDKVANNQKKEFAKKDNYYKLNVEALNQFKAKIEKVEAKRIADANKMSSDNEKLKYKMQQDAKKYSDKKNKDYYKDIKYLDKYKKQLNKEHHANVKNADKRRGRAQKELLKEQEAQKELHTSKVNRFKEYDEKLDVVRKQNNEFHQDLIAREKEKRLIANSQLTDVYRGEKQARQDSELLAKYPIGITEEVDESGSSITIKRIKVTGNQVDVYERVFYTWGGTYFYKNGINITESLWDKESIE